MSFNLWSGGEQLHNTTGIYNSASRTVSVSSDWSSKGNESFYVENPSANITDLIRLSSGNFEIGQYTLKLKVLNQESSINISLFNSTDVKSSVVVPASEEPTDIALTLEVPSTEGYLSCRINSPDDTSFYCDEISLSKR